MYVFHGLFRRDGADVWKLRVHVREAVNMADRGRGGECSC